MKKETAKKNKLWLWIGLGVVALLAVVGIVLALVLGGASKSGGRADLYWNIDRVAFTKDSETGLSTREAAADGLFYVKFAYNGEQVELPVSDKRLVNFIDTMDLMGLVFDNDGVVVDAVVPTDLAVEKAKGVYFYEAKEGAIVANSAITLNGLAMEFAITENTQIYNVSASATMVGEIIDPSVIEVMDTLHVYCNDEEEITHIYLAETPVQSKIYWRIEQMWDSKAKTTTREPDENGVYTIPLWCEGEVVEIKSKDLTLVNEIDSRSFYWCHSAFKFDEEGYAILRINTGTATRSISLVDCYDVMEIDGENISTQPFGSGTPVNFKVNENTKIYETSNLSKYLGTAGQQIDSLKINDRVSVWVDKDGYATTIYVASRRCDSEPYYNVTRKWDSTNLCTKRTPNADGLYEIELWSESAGKQIYLMNETQVNLAESEGYRVLGIKADGQLVQEVYPFESIFGYVGVGNGRIITDVMGSIVTIYSPGGLSYANFVTSADFKAFDMSGMSEYGAPATLQYGDNVKAFRNPPGELVYVIINSRQTGGETLYYNLNRQYDDKAKETKRVPDENGWYVYDVAHNGKTMQVKTKDKELANQLDSFNPGAVVLFVENGIVKRVMDPVSAYSGKKVASAFYFKGYDDEGQAVFYYEGRDDLIYPVSDEVEIFDVSTNSFANRGALTTLRQDDMVTCFTDIYGNLRVVFVRSRKADVAAYNFERLYDTAKASTSRKPDADGWYVFQMAVDGKCRTLKTKNKDLATWIDYQNTAVGLELDGDVIKGYTNSASIPGINSNGVRGYDVIAINGNELTVRYTVTGSVNTGKEQKITIASNAKVYDVSTGDVATFGQKSSVKNIKVGDRITTLKNKDGKHALVYITHKGNRAAGYTSYCPHCDKEVYWCAWAHDGINSGDDSHVYLFRDINTAKQFSMGNKTAEYTVVIDLNGYTWTRTTEGRAIAVSNEEVLYIWDSVGGGKVRATGANGQNAGVLSIGTGAKVNLLSGTLEQIPSDTVKVGNGGVVNMSGESEFHMSGGKLLNGAANQGGALYLSNGILDITGGVIENGTATASGGNIFVYGATSVNIENVTITGGKAAKHGGNIYFAHKGDVLKNCKIENGVAGDKGGNIYVNETAISLIDCTVSNGKAGLFGNNIFHNKGTLNVEGGSIQNGDLMTNKTAKLNLTGAVKAELLNLPKGATMDVSGLTAGASMKVNAEGAFTPEMNNAQAILDAGYITVGTEGAELKLDGKKLTMSGAVLPEEAPIDVTDPTICPHCGVKWEEITWSKWTGAADPASGHYKLEADMTSAHVNIGNSKNLDASIVLDLNGKTWTANEGDYLMGIGLNKSSEINFTIMDRVGGGKLQATGRTDNTAVIMAQNGATLNLFGGTICQVATEGINPYLGVIYANGVTFNMYGGKISGGYTTSTADAAAGNVLLRGTTVMNMYGGEISDGYAAKNSGGVHCYGTAPTFNIYGGTIKNNKGGSGENVYISGGTASVGGTAVVSDGNFACSGNLTITGGNISDLSGKTFKSLTVSGAPVIGKLVVPQGSVITLGELTEGADICVEATGVFTTASDKINDYAGFFRTEVEGDTIKVAGSALTVEGQEPVDTTPCPHCGVPNNEITWTPWTATADPATGHYRLEDNLTTSKHINIGNSANKNADIVLDLNGKIWKSEGGYIMGIGVASESAIKFSIMDSVGGGELQATGSTDEKYDNAGVINLLNGAELNIYGGTLRHVYDENVTLDLVGVLYAYSAADAAEDRRTVVNMYGGTIADGKTLVTPSNGVVAGNVLIRGTAVMNMYGGEIVGGHAKKYGGAVTVFGTFNMTGGKIYNNVSEDVGANLMVTANAIANIGGTAEIYGGVGVNGNDNITCTGTLNITGGKIDGGISGSFKSLTVSGAPVIKNNVVGIAVPAGKVITLGDLTAGANIWVNATGTFTSESEKAAEYASYFHTNVEGVCVAVENSTLVIKEGENPDLMPKTLCPHCDVDVEEIEWKPWVAGINPEDGAHYRLEEDLTTGTMIFGTSANQNSFALDLNGHVWRSTSGMVMEIGSTTNTAVVSILDLAGNGEMQAYGKANDAAVVAVKNGATLNLYSGTLRQLYSKDVSTLYGVVYVNNSKFNMHGGVITDGYTMAEPSNKVVAGNVVLRGGAIMNMDGGLITNGHAKVNAGGVGVFGSTFNMTGGTISGNISDGDGGNIYVNNNASTFVTFSGDAVVKNGVAGGKGANIYTGSATNAVVFENISKIDGDIYAAANVALKGKVSIPMGNSNGIMFAAGKTADVANMAADSEVYFGVDQAANKTSAFTTGGGAAKIACFKNVGRTAAPVASGEELSVTTPSSASTWITSYCPHCDQKVEWAHASSLTGSAKADRLADHDHFFANNNTYNYSLSISGDTAKNKNGQFVFDMNGYAQKSNLSTRIEMAGDAKVAILDTVGGGVLVGKGANGSNGGVINQPNASATGAVVSIYSGTLTSADTLNTITRGGVIAVNGGTLNIYGGIIANGRTNNESSGGAGGNIYLQNSFLNMTGGLVTGGTARLNGGNIYLNSNAYANITGGMIENGTATNQQGGNIVSNYTGTEANTIANVVLRGGTAGTFGGNLSFSAPAKFTVNNVVLAGGNAANGGNLSVGGKLTAEDGVESCEVTTTNCLIYDGTATTNNDVHVAEGATHNN